MLVRGSQQKSSKHSSTHKLEGTTTVMAFRLKTLKQTPNQGPPLKTLLAPNPEITARSPAHHGPSLLLACRPLAGRANGCLPQNGVCLLNLSAISGSYLGLWLRVTACFVDLDSVSWSRICIEALLKAASRVAGVRTRHPAQGRNPEANGTTG